ncbi:MAG: hypothetical protein KDA93_03755 [Planctomycetaceae bacterium]|nr:hypothetical protein [Planctomycetaceae bacterium]
MAKLLMSLASLVLFSTIAIGADAEDQLKAVIVVINEPGTINVEISIGTDDGVKVDDLFDVYRNDEQLGRLKIVQVSADRAVAKITKLNDSKILRRGDNVLSNSR